MEVKQLLYEKERYKESMFQHKQRLMDLTKRSNTIQQQIESVEQETKRKMSQFRVLKQSQQPIRYEVTEVDQLEEELKLIENQTKYFTDMCEKKKRNYYLGLDVIKEAFNGQVNELNEVTKEIKKRTKRRKTCPGFEYTEEIINPEKVRKQQELEQLRQIEREKREREERERREREENERREKELELERIRLAEKRVDNRNNFEIQKLPPHSLLIFFTRPFAVDYKVELAYGKEYIKQKEHYDGIGMIPLDCPWYICYFSKRKCFHYYSITPTGPVMLSVVYIRDNEAPPGRKGGVMAIYRAKARERRTIVPVGLIGKNEDQIMSDQMKSILPIVLGCLNVDPKMKMIPLKSDNLDAALQKYETSQGGIDYKFGLLYCKDGQKTEQEMYDNKGDEISDDYVEFMNVLGDVIPLKGHFGFRAGLDVKSDTTGTHSLYTLFYSAEIMFHVGTMLPHVEADEQKTEKKRHIGNDFCVLIFKEGNDMVDLSSFKSHFNSIFMIVRKMDSKISGDDGTQYMVETWRGRDIPEFEPYLPAKGRYIPKESMREYVLSTLINGQISSYGGAEMKPKMAQAREVCIQNMIPEKK